MKHLNLITLTLLIIGGINWGLVGAFQMDLVAMMFGAGTMMAKIVYIAIGLSALYQLRPLMHAFGMGEVAAQRG